MSTPFLVSLQVVERIPVGRAIPVSVEVLPVSTLDTTLPPVPSGRTLTGTF